jgi:hypothetical protein
MKKNTILSITVLLLASLSLSACSLSLPFITVMSGSGTLATETRQVSGFDKIQLDGAGRLIITQGSEESLEIQAEDNILPELTSDVSGNTLILGYQEKTWRRTVIPTREIVYTLTVTDLRGISFNGAASLEMDVLDTDDLKITINGAGQVNINDLTAENLDIQINGTGNVELAGEVINQTINIDGAGNVRAGDLRSEVTTIEVNGLGNATIWVLETLNVNFNGGGTLNYYGSPNVHQNINGAGSINNLGDK